MKPTLTVLVYRTPAGELLARGIAKDVTQFEHAYFADAGDFARYMRFLAQAWRLVIEMPGGVR